MKKPLYFGSVFNSMTRILFGTLVFLSLLYSSSQASEAISLPRHTNRTSRSSVGLVFSSLLRSSQESVGATCPIIPLAKPFPGRFYPTETVPQFQLIQPFPSCPWAEGPSRPVSYTHLRAHETRHDLVCRLLLEKKKKQT